MNFQDANLGFGNNAYLRVAYDAIQYAKAPLSPSEILELARTQGFLPTHLLGLTMHKTLAARLAEHIRKHSNKSVFFRTAPAKFFIHTLASLDDVPEEHKKVHVGNLRAKSIRKENVLVAKKVDLNAQITGEYTPYEEEAFQVFYNKHCHFVDRAEAENDDDIKQFVTFTLVLHGSNILVYRRGKFTTTSDELKGQFSVGFGGHVNDTDFDLFNSGGGAFRNNAARELKEELFLDEIYKERYEAESRARVLGYINVDDSPAATHHIAVLIAFFHSVPELPKKGELSINQLAWHNLNDRYNDLSDFDLWSGMILRNIYSGKIDIHRNSFHAS
jgi:predicted NUDIX family phosphoesterase